MAISSPGPSDKNQTHHQHERNFTTHSAGRALEGIDDVMHFHMHYKRESSSLNRCAGRRPPMLPNPEALSSASMHIDRIDLLELVVFSTN